MELRHHIFELISAIRDFIAPSYRPELYYMRGPGPAYARAVAKARIVRR